MEWNKGFVSFASMKEVREGKGSPNGGVYYGRGQVPWETFERIATAAIFPNWKYKALDLSELGRMLKDNEPVEVGPAVEYFDGGIVINEKFETTLPGLYAAGECTLGPFGANRVCSAITEMLVHGADAGQNAGEYTKKTKALPPDAQTFSQLQEIAECPLKRKDGLKPAQVRRRVQETAHKHLGPSGTRKNSRHSSDFWKISRKRSCPTWRPPPKNGLITRNGSTRSSWATWCICSKPPQRVRCCGRKVGESTSGKIIPTPITTTGYRRPS